MAEAVAPWFQTHEAGPWSGCLLMAAPVLHVLFAGTWVGKLLVGMCTVSSASEPATPEAYWPGGSHKVELTLAGTEVAGSGTGK